MSLKNTFRELTEKAILLLGHPKAPYVILGLFIAQTIYIALSMKIGIPPDELTHIRFIEYYRDNSLSPLITDQTSGFAIGDVTREVSYLYHYIMSLILRVLPFAYLTEYIILRFFGIVFAVLTIVMSIKTVNLLKISPVITMLGVIIITNLSEFQLMSSSINNDNVVWLLTATGAYLSVRLWQAGHSGARDLLLLMLVISFGALVKKTFLPIALVLAFVVLLFLWAQRHYLMDMLKKVRIVEILLMAMIVVGVSLSIERIGLNIIQYGNIDVICDQVHKVDQCLEFGVYRRNYNLPNGENLGELGFAQFAPAWLYETLGSIFGTQAWVGSYRPHPLVNVLLVLIFISALVAAIHNRKSHKPYHIPVMLIFLTTLSYIALNMFINYEIYERRGIFGLALQGRYIFPVLPLFILLAIHYFSIYEKRHTTLMRLFAVCFFVLTIALSSLGGVIRSPQIIENPLQPVLIFNPEKAISKYEPSI